MDGLSFWVKGGKMKNNLLLGILLAAAVLVIGFIGYRSIGFSSAKTSGTNDVETPVKEEVALTDAVANDDQSVPKKGTKKTVVVELFTSEGCSSCPPADYVLSRLGSVQPVQDVEVITLGQHVDYWNRLGWKDVYSSSEMSARQNEYAQAFNSDQVYTPQMVVDGSTEFVGSNMQKAQAAIIEAAKLAKATVEINPVNAEFQKQQPITLKINIKDLPKRSESVEVFLALTEDNLISNVSRGENSGRNLQHDSVVRQLKSVATIATDANLFSGETSFQLQNDWKRKDLHAVVFVQESKSRKIIGAAQIGF